MDFSVQARPTHGSSVRTGSSRYAPWSSSTRPGTSSTTPSRRPSRLLPRRRRVRRHRLGDRDRARLGVPDRHPRHPRHRQARPSSPRRSRSPTAVHDAEQGAARVLAAHRHASTTSPPTSAASRTCSRPWTRRPYTGRHTMALTTRWAPTTRSPGARTTRAAAPSTPAPATPPRASPTPTSASTSRGAIAWAAGQADPVYSDCGATVLANYQQTKICGAAEPQRADRLRPAARTAA